MKGERYVAIEIPSEGVIAKAECASKSVQGPGDKAKASQLVEEIKTTIRILIMCCKKEEPRIIDIPKPQMKEKAQLLTKGKKRRPRYLRWMDWEAAQYPK